MRRTPLHAVERAAALWALPGTAAVMEYRRTHSREAFERFFDEYAIVPTDPRWPFVV